MSTPLGTQLLAVYDKYNARADLLHKSCGVRTDKDAYTDFESKVRNRFLKGVHSAFQEAIVKALTEELGTQQEVANALDLKDRSSISQMIRSGTIEGIRITTALHRFPHLIRKMPSQELAALYGFARATSFLKALAFDEASIEGSMTHQDFSYLVGVLAEPEWETAIRSSDPLPARELAVQIILDRTINATDPKACHKQRPEQRVMMLQELRNRWGDFAILVLLTIPDDIPEDVARGEVTI